MTASHSIEEDIMLVRLIEERLFLNHADKCNNNAMSNDQKYLVEEVFPTLVPGLHDLLKCYKNCSSESETASRAENDRQPDPVMWLAQYLLRNNTHDKTSRLASHPFQLVNNAVIRSTNNWV